MTEKRPVKGYEDRYEIYSDGNVWSIKRKRFLYQNLKSNYLMVRLYSGKGWKCKLVHRLVLEAFIPNIENKPCGNHMDGNKHNNNLSNLEWMTYPENCLHAHRTGLAKGTRGSQHGRAILNDFQVRRIRLMRELKPRLLYREIAKLFGVTPGHIYNIVKRRYWRKFY